MELSLPPPAVFKEQRACEKAPCHITAADPEAVNKTARCGRVQIAFYVVLYCAAMVALPTVGLWRWMSRVEAPRADALIVRLKGTYQVKEVLEMCERGRGSLTDASEVWGPGRSEQRSCQLSEGACARTFDTLIHGVAGDFTQSDRRALRDCLADDAVVSLESDASVRLQEDSRPVAVGSLRDDRALVVEAAGDDYDEVTAFSGISGWQPSNIVMSDINLIRSVLDMTHGFSFNEFVARPFDRVEPDDEPKKDRVIWNLDRLDQRGLPLDNAFVASTEDCLNVSSAASAGEGVTIYVVDSGVITNHREFNVNASDSESTSWGVTNGTEGIRRASHGYDFVDDDGDASDCNGHGTHVASSAVGLSVGVAKGANVVGVRVLDCEGDGKIRNVIAGLEWVVNNAQRPAIITLSLGVPVGAWSSALEDVIDSVLHEHNISVIVASGNGRTNSCNVSPAAVPGAITVGASKMVDTGVGTATDERRLREGIYSFGNYGRCIDIFAPGTNIFGACGGAERCEEVREDAYTLASGTSMAVPHVAGVAAVYLSHYPSASPARVKRAILDAATPGVFGSEEAQMRQGAPNLLLYSRLTQCYEGDDGAS